MAAGSRRGSRDPAPATPIELGDPYRGAVVIDGSVCPQDMFAPDHISRMRESGVTAFVWTVCPPDSTISTGLAHIGRALTDIAAHSDDLLLVRTADDIETAKSSGRIGLILGPQNAQLAAESLAHFTILHEVGVRVLQLTYNLRSAFGDGCVEAADAGLSNLGREAVTELNRLGIVIDLSHAGPRTAQETIDASSDPVIVSHSNPRAVYENPRNISDDLIKRVAAAGGVVGICLWSALVGPGRRTGGQPTLDDYLRHIDHVIDLVGPAHVAISSDHGEGRVRQLWSPAVSSGGDYPTVTQRLGDWYGFDTRSVVGADGCRDWAHVAHRIRELGLDEADLRGVLGGNLLRVFGKVWDHPPRAAVDNPG
ncbi:dipeptidase [Solwaraspora sp. WMMB335]|uniref:dipeptidase n=1 Tax=Solwaraspora sp. WMMB335 TaxID=3404118 RepID=UPI003B94581F